MSTHPGPGPFPTYRFMGFSACVRFGAVRNRTYHFEGKCWA